MQTGQNELNELKLDREQFQCVKSELERRCNYVTEKGDFGN